MNKNKTVKVKKVGKSSHEVDKMKKRVTFCKKLLTHDHESENHTVVAC